MTPWTVARQALLSMEFSRQEYWGRLPFSPLGDLPNPEIEPVSLALQADSLPSELPGKPFNYYLVLVAQSYPTLCDPIDNSPPGSSVHGISQARIREPVVISFSRGSCQPRDQTSISCICCHWQAIVYHRATWNGSHTINTGD